MLVGTKLLTPDRIISAAAAGAMENVPALLAPFIDQCTIRHTGFICKPGWRGGSLSLRMEAAHDEKSATELDFH